MGILGKHKDMNILSFSKTTKELRFYLERKKVSDQVVINIK